ncbi:hypothetical protein KAU11_03950 [Candidatus Babeliales bacterium]|nr:hypothetical protein [Candidatus Babeliales bacterium]
MQNSVKLFLIVAVVVGFGLRGVAQDDMCLLDKQIIRDALAYWDEDGIVPDTKSDPIMLKSSCEGLDGSPTYWDLMIKKHERSDGKPSGFVVYHFKTNCSLPTSDRFSIYKKEKGICACSSSKMYFHFNKDSKEFRALKRKINACESFARQRVCICTMFNCFTSSGALLGFSAMAATFLIKLYENKKNQKRDQRKANFGKKDKDGKSEEAPQSAFAKTLCELKKLGQNKLFYSSLVVTVLGTSALCIGEERLRNWGSKIGLVKAAV